MYVVMLHYIICCRSVDALQNHALNTELMLFNELQPAFNEMNNISYMYECCKGLRLCECTCFHKECKEETHMLLLLVLQTQARGLH